MAFSAAEVANIGNALFDKALTMEIARESSNDDGNRTLYDAIVHNAGKRKTYKATKGNIIAPVQGEYTTTVQGYNTDDVVGYANPANIKQVNYTPKEHHSGLGVTLTEMKRDGVITTETASKLGELEEPSRMERAHITSLMKNKVNDLIQGYHNGMAVTLWGDGSADAKKYAGIRSLILDNPSAANQSVGGLSTTNNSWWRNYAHLAIANTANGLELTEALDECFRNIRRYNKNAEWVIVCGFDFEARLFKEMRNKGMLTETGWRGNDNDMAVNMPKYRGIPIMLDYNLNDLGTVGAADMTKRAYIVDCSRIRFYAFDGDYMAKHTPPRPHDKYVFYQALTTTGALVADQLNSSAVLALS